MARERLLSKVLIALLSVCYLCGSKAEGPLAGVSFSRLSATSDSQRLIKDTFLIVCDKDNHRGLISDFPSFCSLERDQSAICNK